ncbi:MAG: c-type cytochrome [Bacteroidota bacterium]
MERFKKFIKSLYFLFGTIIVLVVVLFSVLLYYNSNPTYFLADKSGDEFWTPNDIVNDPLRNFINPEARYGFLLVSESPSQMGPQAPDESMKYAGNNLKCTNCHLKNGTQAGSGSWVGVTDRFPQFGARGNKIGTIEDRVNGCLERSMNGRKMPVDSKPMKAIVAYMEWLSEDVPKEKEAEYKGFPSIKLPDVAANVTTGKDIYNNQCMVCHGENGQGQRAADFAQGYVYPPLWGEDSYNHGAGMHRVITAAEFIKGNMPFEEATWDNPKLTDEEAYHVAAYINSFDRPLKSLPENDFPDKKLKPVSTPYGPWEDSFSAEQHKYGPFPPIIEFYKKKYDISKTK